MSCVSSTVFFTRLYRGARSTKHKISLLLHDIPYFPPRKMHPILSKALWPK